MSATKLKLYRLLLWSMFFTKIESKEFIGKAFFEKTKVYYNAKEVKDHQVRINPDNTSLDISMVLTKSFKEDPWMAAGLHQRVRNTNRFRTLLQFDYNVCSLIGIRETNLLSTFIRKFSDLSTRTLDCPFTKGNYSWPGVSTDSLHVPPLFKRKYQVNVITYFPRKSTKYILTNVTVFMKVV
ncbi:uncharacterized protein LOC142223598 [Haematobia irritans]|uniref:uncharacterized protein LOC142223598 n=1 Tax=Haematobia irritans TaxID=7368 RepID=UPI003F5091BC